MRCIGSSLLQWAVSGCEEQGLLSPCGVRALRYRCNFDVKSQYFLLYTLSPASVMFHINRHTFYHFKNKQNFLKSSLYFILAVVLFRSLLFIQEFKEILTYNDGLHSSFAFHSPSHPQTMSTHSCQSIA